MSCAKIYIILAALQSLQRLGFSSYLTLSTIGKPHRPRSTENIRWNISEERSFPQISRWWAIIGKIWWQFYMFLSFGIFPFSTDWKSLFCNKYKMFFFKRLKIPCLFSRAEATRKRNCFQRTLTYNITEMVWVTCCIHCIAFIWENTKKKISVLITFSFFFISLLLVCYN